MARENTVGSGGQQGVSEVDDGLPVHEEDVAAVKEFANPT